VDFDFGKKPVLHHEGERQRVVKKPSVLVFELSDLANPFMRFSGTDHAQCDVWLHRVRSAMARHAKAVASST
jgi:hypothetical protein